MSVRYGARYSVLFGAAPYRKTQPLFFVSEGSIVPYPFLSTEWMEAARAIR
ncbi:MAG: hypothetical protein ACO33G_00795 [Ilumatobacteraceae bacterium]